MTATDRIKAAADLIERAATRAHNDMRHTKPRTPERLRQVETMMMFRKALDLLAPPAEGQHENEVTNG